MSRGIDGTDRCVGCGMRVPAVGLDDEALCPECAAEDELENLSDLDDEGDAA
jgi:hypothetical protein